MLTPEKGAFVASMVTRVGQAQGSQDHYFKREEINSHTIQEECHFWHSLRPDVLAGGIVETTGSEGYRDL
jgi:hypothetical protein